MSDTDTQRVLVDCVANTMTKLAIEQAALRDGVSRIEALMRSHGDEHQQVKPLVEETRGLVKRIDESLIVMKAEIVKIAGETSGSGEKLNNIGKFVALVRKPLMLVILLVGVIAAVVQVREWVKSALGLPKSDQVQTTGGK